MQRKITFVINPISGKRKGVQVERLLAKVFPQDRFALQVVRTAYIRHAVELSRQAVADRAEVVVALVVPLAVSVMV